MWLFFSFMLSNIGKTSGMLVLLFFYCFIVLFKKVILSSFDLVVTTSITNCDLVIRVVNLDSCGVQGRDTPGFVHSKSCLGAMTQVRLTGNAGIKAFPSHLHPKLQHSNIFCMVNPQLGPYFILVANSLKANATHLIYLHFKAFTTMKLKGHILNWPR